MKLIIIHPKRGPIPPCPEGYEREKGDPYIFHKIWPSCWFHSAEDICAMYLKKVNQNDCEKCTARCPTEST